MSIWTRLGELLSAVSNDAFSTLVETIRTFFEGDPVTRKKVAFSIAIIAMSAKMAKADGIVTHDEVLAFQELFEVPEDEVHNVARLYNLAKQDVSGFEHYAAQIKRLFTDDKDILHDVLDGLFHIAKSDGFVHESEMEFVTIVANIFGITGNAFEQVRLRHVAPEEGDPYVIMGAQRDWTEEVLKKHYRELLNEIHPDKMMARGVPREFLKISNDRMADINIAWKHIKTERGF